MRSASVSKELTVQHKGKRKKKSSPYTPFRFFLLCLLPAGRLRTNLAATFFGVSAAQVQAHFLVFFLVLLGDFCLEKEHRDKESALLIRRMHGQIAVGAFQQPWRAFLTEADSAKDPAY